ncbi:HTH-type transcriptional regulator YesS [Paenibacillus konkukensis]|uniref:HTH-type transcriptional regulator YesS n=1 Tax=Paenibacillus konkukensis TaxID=2020716 RepID=A0ABY4RLU6_9BACL|nr:helix-turn-helix domain-containing protein [Paenibacillus konkukensis]UQZ83461.1 HTH-type transcriptional regulator YesS [Paenibacillus konkukensis]
MMRNRGFHKLLLSYLPVFAISSIVLILAFVLTFMDYVDRNTKEMAKAHAENSLQLYERALSSVDQLITAEILSSPKLKTFFDQQEFNVFEQYQMLEYLVSLKNANDLISSLYLYRTRDEMIVSTYGTTDLSAFGDKANVEYYAGGTDRAVWSDPRPFKVYMSEEPVAVVSLTKQVSFGSGNKGLVVVNLDMRKLERIFTDYTQSSIAASVLLDSRGQRIFGPLPEVKDVASRLPSKLTGWTMDTYIQLNEPLRKLSLFSHTWVLAGFAVLLGCFGWLIYAVYRNYKPIEKIIASFQRFSRREGEWDEFQFIQHSIEQLLETSQQVEDFSKENAAFRKTYFFNKLIEGDLTVFESVKEESLWELGLNPGCNQFLFAVLGIDRYSQFEAEFSYRDQNLFKFAIYSVVKEMADNHGLHVWHEWIASHQIGIILQSNKDGDFAKLASQYGYELRDWVNRHYKLDVTIAIGEPVAGMEHVSHSRQTTLDALNYSASLGTNQVIGYWDAQDDKEREVYGYLPQLRSVAGSLRLGRDSWRAELAGIFRHMESQHLSNAEIINLMNYLIYCFSNEMSEMSAEYQRLWNRVSLELSEAVAQLVTMEELTQRVLGSLERFGAALTAMRQMREGRSTIERARELLQEQYADPDLSIAKMCELFQMTSPQFSRLFKEEIGETFMDYLARIRVEQAQKLLKETEDSIQDVAKQVGYLHSYSFIRAFKRWVGKTPGDYRSQG